MATPDNPIKADFSADSWTTASSSYAERVGRMSIQSCDRLISQAHRTHPFSPSSSHVLDQGAGTGVLTSVLTARFPSIRVLATDISPGMVSAIEAKHLPNVAAKLVDACVLDNVEDLGAAATFSHVFSTFMLQFAPQPHNVVREMHRVLEPGGFVGLAMWGERIGPFAIWEEACRRLDPTYELPQQQFDKSAWRTQRELEDAMREAGYEEVKSEVVPMHFEFQDSGSYVEFWLKTSNPVAERLVKSFRGDLEVVERELEKVLHEKYDDGRGIFIDGILATGTK